MSSILEPLIIKETTLFGRVQGERHPLALNSFASMLIIGRDMPPPETLISRKCPYRSHVMNDAILPVLIVGAGPVGLAMACELLRRGIYCRIIDRAPAPTPLHESRALAIWERTLEVFDDMGVVGQVLERGREIHCIRYYAGGKEALRLDLGLEGADIRYRHPISLPQGETERILVERLSSCGGEVERETRLIALEQDPEGVSATVVGPGYRVEELRVQWLIGCDGAGSTVRKLLVTPFEGSEYPEQFFLADVRMSWDVPQNEARIFLLPEGGGVAAFPLPMKDHWRLIDATGTPGGEKENIAAISHRFRSLLQESGRARAALSGIVWQSSFRLHRRIAARFRTGRCFLAGDAAHIHSPLGGQGMNTGIQDAYNLAWKLALMLSGKGGERLLQSYEAERRPVALSVLRATDLATRGIMLHGHTATAIRDRAIGILGRREKVLVKIRRRLSEIDVSYPGSPIVDGDAPSGNRPAPGDRLPDVVVGMKDETPVRLRDLLRGERHHLLLFTGSCRREEDISTLEHLVATVTAIYPDVVAVRLVHHPQAPALSVTAEETVADEDANLHRLFSFSSPSLLLVRPDGYIGFREAGIRTGYLNEYLGLLFG